MDGWDSRIMCAYFRADYRFYSSGGTDEKKKNLVREDMIMHTHNTQERRKGNPWYGLGRAGLG